MKISEVTRSIAKNYCGVYEDDSDQLIDIMMSSAKSFIIGYTGLTEEELEDHEDITDAYLVLINDMFSQRDYTLSWQKQINPAADAILHMYAKNYL